MSKKAWILSLLFPALITAVYICLACFVLSGSAIDNLFTHAMGILCGIVPLILTLRFKVDTSQIIKDRFILLSLPVCGVFFILFGTIINLIVFLIIIAIEVSFLDTHFMPLLNKVIIALSNPAFLLYGFAVDFCNLLNQGFPENFG